MLDLIKTLKSFNRKERFYLVSQALGNKDFTLSDEFREQVGNKLNISIPSNAFAAMDYHLDWIYASLKYFKESKTIYPKDENIKATQEDVDLIIAFYNSDTYHLILIEAKGDTAWTNKQLDSKSKRLVKIFGYNGDNWSNVNPYYLIMSPRPSKKLDISIIPKWMLCDGNLNWLPLEMPDYLVKVTRCEKNKKQNEKGGYWKIG